MAKKPAVKATDIALEQGAALGTELATFVPDNPVMVLTDPKQFDALLGKIEAEVAAHVPNLDTAKGRAAIKSLAYKVTRTKTALDDAGKELNAEKRAEIDAVDAVRRDVRAKLDALTEKARKPLDDWESAEEARQRHVTDLMQEIDVLAEVSVTDTSEDIGKSRERLVAMVFDADLFQEWLEIAVAKKNAALNSLDAAYDRAVQAEADAAELTRLRQEAAEREQREADAHAEAERKRVADEEEKRRRDEAAEEVERKKREDAEREQKRLDDIAAAERRAAEDARIEAERVAQEKIDAANAEAERLRKEAGAKAETERRAAEEQAARDADRAHRSAIMKAAKEAIMTHGIKEPEARSIVLAIVAGEIPNVKLTF